MKQIRRALISVFHKDGILDIAQKLALGDVEILSTGGTAAFLRDNGVKVTEVEDLT